MPGKDGKLTVAERHKIGAWLNHKAIGNSTNCPTCGQNAWSLAEHLVQGSVFYPDTSLRVGGPSYPQILLVCNICAYTRAFMAIPILGVNLSAEGSEATPATSEGKNV